MTITEEDEIGGTEGTRAIEVIARSLPEFDATDSHNPDRRIVKYEWEFGDGTKGEGKVVTHAFSVPGTYTIKLTVTDDDGATASINKEEKVSR